MTGIGNGIESLVSDRPDEVVFERARAVVGADATAPCQVVDMRLVPGEQSHILLQVGERYVVGTVANDEAPLCLRPIEADGALGGLPIIHNNESLTALVDQWLPGGGVSRCRAQLLRYRPGRRATFVVEKATVESGKLQRRRIIVKLYHEQAKAEAVHQAMVALHDRPQTPPQALTYSATHSATHSATDAAIDSVISSAESTLRLQVAEPAGIDRASGIVGQHLLFGQPLEPMLTARSDRATNAISQAAEALAVVHDLPVISDRSRSVEKTVKKLNRRSAALHEALPDGCDSLVSLTQRLSIELDERETQAPAHHLLHGDAKPDQFLLLGTGVGLLDFDHVGVGDPALDVADFTGKLLQRSLASGRPDRATSEHFQQVFLNAYTQATGSGSDMKQRVEFCAAVSTARRALRSYQRAPRSQLGPLLVAACTEQLNKLNN